MNKKLKPSQQAANQTVNLTVPLTGVPATQFHTVKDQTGVSANTEVARLILFPALALASKVGFQNFLQILKDLESTTPKQTEART
jgi:hypothetical protein